jgi:predicted enzyme related to lactoylglutathione lyase
VTIYVEVEDVRSYVAKAVGLGGSIVAPPYDVPDRGITIAFVADPEGHVVGISQGLQGAMEQLGFTN